MAKLLLILQSAAPYLSLFKRRIALYFFLSIVTQVLIPVALIPNLLKEITDDIPKRSEDISAGQHAAFGKNRQDSRAALRPYLATACCEEPRNMSFSKAALMIQHVELLRGPVPINAHLGFTSANIAIPYVSWLLLIALLVPLNIVYRLAQNDLDSAMESAMRNGMLSNVLKQPPEFFQSHDPGKLSTAVTQMVTQAQYAFRSISIEPLTQLLSLAIAIYMIVRDLHHISGVIAWVSTSVVLVVGFFSVYAVQSFAGREFAESQAQLQDNSLAVAGIATAILSAPQDIQSMNAESFVTKIYGARLDAFFKSKRTQVYTVELANSLLGLPTQLILACLFGFVVYAVCFNRPGISPGTIVAFSYLVPRLMEPFRTFAALGMTAASSWPAVELVTKWSSQKSRISDGANAVELVPNEPTIEFRDVSFRYDSDSRKVFDDVSFTIPPKKITGLCGRFGQGKTTFFRLVLRFYDPQEGQILLAGQLASDLELISLRNQISMMSQDPKFFHMTVRDNFRLARPDASDAEIVRVAVSTGVWDVLLERLGPDPLNKPFAAGEILSGGQKRKFSLSCALLRNSSYIFLDEPSSNLSADELAELISIIRTSCADKTVVVVDHSLPAFIVPLCDHVLVLEDGRIAQRGTPEHLLAEKGIFRELHDAQLPGLSYPVAQE
jgi:ATP-binding cassette subfamily B protein